VIAGATDGAPADGVRQFILRDQADCHRLAHVLRSVIRLHLPMDPGAAAPPHVADQREGRG